jgi:hypothetical protein
MIRPRFLQQPKGPVLHAPLRLKMTLGVEMCDVLSWSARISINPSDRLPNSTGERSLVLEELKPNLESRCLL